MLEGLPHYWINRHADVERRRLAEAAFARAGVAHARVEAATPATLPEVSVRKPLANSLSELAIVVSHLRAVGAAHAGGSAAAVVMEDDVRAHYLFDARALMASAPPDWDILQLHVSHAPVVLALGELYLAHGILWHEWEPSFYSAGAYLINRAAMARLLARYCPDGIRLDLGGVHAHGKLVADHLLFRRAACYTATVPFFFNDVALHSTHAPQRDATHHRPGALGVDEVRRRIGAQIAAGRGWPGIPAPAGYPFAVRAP
jgi:hypothetical protein